MKQSAKLPPSQITDSPLKLKSNLLIWAPPAAGVVHCRIPFFLDIFPDYFFRWTRRPSRIESRIVGELTKPIGGEKTGVVWTMDPKPDRRVEDAGSSRSWRYSCTATPNDPSPMRGEELTSLPRPTGLPLIQSPASRQFTFHPPQRVIPVHLS